MKIPSWFVATVGLVVICAAGGTAAFANGTLVVGVYDASTTDPISGALVEVILDDSVIKSATTPSSGEVTFSLAAGSNYSVTASKSGYIPFTWPHVNIIDDVTTRLSIPLVACPVSAAFDLLLGDDSQQKLSGSLRRVAHATSMKTVRSFRDDVLSQSAEGQRLCRLYYRHGAEITRILREHPEMRLESSRTGLALLPSLVPASAEQPTVTLPDSTYQRGLRLLAAVQTKAGPELRADLDVVRQIVQRRSEAAGRNLVRLDFASRRSTRRELVAAK